MADQYRVLRPFEGKNGQRFQPGEIVDTSGWLWTQRLVERRFITPVTGEVEPARSPRARAPLAPTG